MRTSRSAGAGRTPWCFPLACVQASLILLAGCEPSKRSYVAEGVVFAIDDRETPLIVHMLHDSGDFAQEDNPVAVDGVEVSVSSTRTLDGVLPGSAAVSDESGRYRIAIEKVPETQSNKLYKYYFIVRYKGAVIHTQQFYMFSMDDYSKQTVLLPKALVR